MKDAARRASELARELADSLGQSLGLLLGGVVAVTLLALVLGSFGARYEARLELAFPAQPAPIRGLLPPPVRDLRSDAVMRDLRRSLRARKADAGDLAERLIVLQHSDEAAQMVAEGRSRGAATGLVLNWAQSFLAARTRELGRALDRRRQAADARLRRAATLADRRRALSTVSQIDAATEDLPDAVVVRGPTLSGYRDLVPWPAPLAGLALGAIAAIAKGTRRGRLRAEAARSLGPPVLARVGTHTSSGSNGGIELLLVKLALRAGGRSPRSLVLTPLDDLGEPAARLAAALEARSGTRARVEAWDEGPPGPDGAWVALITLGAIDRDTAADRLAGLTNTGRTPDGLVLLDREAPA